MACLKKNCQGCSCCRRRDLAELIRDLKNREIHRC